MGIASKSISAIISASICKGYAFHVFFRDIEGWGGRWKAEEGGGNAKRSEASVARAKPGNSS